jgi:hypothetical protein
MPELNYRAQSRKGVENSAVTSKKALNTLVMKILFATANYKYFKQSLREEEIIAARCKVST